MGVPLGEETFWSCTVRYVLQVVAHSKPTVVQMTAGATTARAGLARGSAKKLPQGVLALQGSH